MSVVQSTVTRRERINDPQCPRSSARPYGPWKLAPGLRVAGHNHATRERSVSPTRIPLPAHLMRASSAHFFAAMRLLVLPESTLSKPLPMLDEIETACLTNLKSGSMTASRQKAATSARVIAPASWSLPAVTMPVGGSLLRQPG